MLNNQSQTIALNKFFLSFTLLFMGAFSMLQAQSIDSVFINMPDDFLPSLTKEMKIELVENFKLNKTDTIKDSFQNKVYVLNYDSVRSTIDVQSASNAKFEMKLFSAENAKMNTSSFFIGVINTVCAPLCSSYIRFYDKNWRQLEVNFIVPQASDWLLNKNEEKQGVKLADIFKSTLIELDFNNTKNELVLKNHSNELLSIEDKLFLKSFLSEADKIYKIQISDNKIIVNQ